MGSPRTTRYLLWRGPRLGLCEPGTLVVLRQNPSLYLLADARTLAALAKLAAREGDSWLEASHTRASILLTVAALEGFINAVYENSDTPHLDTKLRMHPREKGCELPMRCCPTEVASGTANGCCIAQATRSSPSSKARNHSSPSASILDAPERYGSPEEH